MAVYIAACFDPGSGKEDTEAGATATGATDASTSSAAPGSTGEASSTTVFGSTTDPTQDESESTSADESREEDATGSSSSSGSETRGEDSSESSDGGQPWVPTSPPVENGQAADLVLGQPDFATLVGGAGDTQFDSAGGLASDGEHLWVMDLGNHRVVQFNAQPVVNEPRADVAVGQESLRESIVGPDALHLAEPEGSTGYYARAQIGDVSIGGGRLVVVDGANRILSWDTIPAASGLPWDLVLGQTTPTGAAPGTNASSLSSPEGVWTDGERIVVADTQNHRVLIWSSIPDANGAPANLVLGQADFVSAENPSPPTARSMNAPSDVFFDGERLFVSDKGNHRVMVWSGFPATNNAPADYIIGQTSPNTGEPNAGAGTNRRNAIGLEVPSELVVAYGSLFICDRGRVVVHTPVPSTSGEMADAVLGEADLEGTPLDDPDQAIEPRGIAVFGDKLFVSHSNEANGTSRVMRYQLHELP